MELSVIARIQGDFKEAQRRLEQAITLFPKYPDAYLELSRLYKKMNDEASARAALDRYLALGGSPAKIKTP